MVQESSRMSKTKMRCITCGKWFQSANAREVTCPDCTQKARKEKQAAKNAPPIASKPVGASALSASTQSKPVAPPKPKPKTTQGGTNQWLDNLSDVKIGEPDQPPQRPKVPSSPAQRDRNAGSGGNRPPYPNAGPNMRDNRGHGPAAYHVSNGASIAPAPGQRPQQPSYRSVNDGPPNRAKKPWSKNPAPGGPKQFKGPKAARPAPEPKVKREKTPPPEPFTPTPEQIVQVEERYTLLAQPSEFDGIRTQISKEFDIPKKAIKKIIKDLRDRQHIPSWWEIQTYKGSQEELERIKDAYQPYLPVPPVGVHKEISDKLNLKPGTVYQAIKTIRIELKLPQYNDPKYHEEEIAAHIKKLQAKKVAETTDNAVVTNQVSTSDTTDETVIANQVSASDTTDETVIANQVPDNGSVTADSPAQSE
jgi:predicted  nucleic acid-binding Zn-ribbon protein